MKKATVYSLEAIRNFTLEESLEAERDVRRQLVLERTGRELRVGVLRPSDIRKLKKNVAQILTLRHLSQAASSSGSESQLTSTQESLT